MMTIFAAALAVVVAGFVWWRLRRTDVGYPPPPVQVVIRVDVTAYVEAMRRVGEAMKQVAWSAEQVGSRAQAIGEALRAAR